MAFRLMKDFYELVTHQELRVTVKMIENNCYKWEGTLIGPPETPFENGAFQFTIDFPGDYPDSPPEFYFTTPMYHPNIGGNGKVCFPIFGSEWNRQISALAFMSYIILLLNQPNPYNGYWNEATDVCLESIELWREKAWEFTTKYALQKFAMQKK